MLSYVTNALWGVAGYPPLAGHPVNIVSTKNGSSAREGALSTRRCLPEVLAEEPKNLKAGGRMGSSFDTLPRLYRDF